MTAEGGTKVVVLGLAANLAIAVFKYFAAYVSGSSSMLAEGHHSLADTFNQAFLLFGIKRSRKAPTEKHPFGYGKVQFFWSFVVTLILFGVAGGLSIKGGVMKVLHREPLEGLFWSVSAIIVALILEGLALKASYVALRAAMAEAGETSLVRAFHECTDAVVITAFMENLLAVLGLLIAGAAIPLARVLNRPEIDGYASILIGAVLMGFAFLLALEVKSMLIGEGLPGYMLRRIRETILSGPGVRGIVYMRTLVLGPEDALVAVKVEFDPRMPVAELERAIDRIEAGVRVLLPNAHCFIEAGSLRDCLHHKT